MKVRNLLEVVKDVILVIAHHTWHLVVLVVDVLEVVVDDLLQILGELFLRFDQLANDGSGEKAMFITF